MILDKKLVAPPPVEKPEWSRIAGRAGWWLHRDGVRKSFVPDGGLPDPEHEPDPVDFDITLRELP